MESQSQVVSRKSQVELPLDTGNGEPVTGNQQLATGNKTVVKVRWPTNYNNKMDCDAFIHLDLAPSQVPKYSQLEKTVIELSTDDGSHPPVMLELLDIVPVPYQKVTDVLTLPSHGMTEPEFSKFLMDKYPYDRPGDSSKGIAASGLCRQGLAVYYYRRVNDKIKIHDNSTGLF